MSSWSGSYDTNTGNEEHNEDEKTCLLFLQQKLPVKWCKILGNLLPILFIYAWSKTVSWSGLCDTNTGKKGHNQCAKTYLLFLQKLSIKLWKYWWTCYARHLVMHGQKRFPGPVVVIEILRRPQVGCEKNFIILTTTKKLVKWSKVLRNFLLISWQLCEKFETDLVFPSTLELPCSGDRSPMS